MVYAQDILNVRDNNDRDTYRDETVNEEQNNEVRERKKRCIESMTETTRAQENVVKGP
jgi:hypothetical protein